MSIKNSLFFNTAPQRRAQGFTLLEVLVAVIVLSIGLMGLASLQAVALRNNKSSSLRSQSTVLAYEIVDRMRANRRLALNGDDNPNGDYNTDFSAPTCVAELDLSEGTIAKRDLIQWKNTLACSLPSGDGRIVRSNGNLFTISVRWDDNWGQENPQKTFTVTLQL